MAKAGSTLGVRQRQLLSVLVREYIRTAQPVSSAQLVARYDLECSSATVRNELARLEELGYLGQPHTSAGRVPLDRAYRFYVDSLVESGLERPAEAPRIEAPPASGGGFVEGLLEQASRLLSETTRHTALVLAPRLRRGYCRYLQLVPLGPRRLLFVMLSKTGSLVEKRVDLSVPVTPELLEGMTEALNRRLRGMPLTEISYEVLGELRHSVDEQLLDTIRLTAAEDTLARDNRLVLVGASHLAEQPEFQDVDRLREILRVLDEEKILAEVLNKTLDTPGFRVWIGRENELEEMRGCSLLAVPYHLRGEPIGTLGLLGPTRMPYGRMLSVLEQVALSVSQRLELLGTL